MGLQPALRILFRCIFDVFTSMNDVKLPPPLTTTAANPPLLIYYGSWFAMLFSTALWSGFYLSVQHLFPEKSPEWCSRAVTFVHGAGSALTGLSECYFQLDSMFESPNEAQTSNQQIILLVSLGYFLFDLIWCLSYQTESWLMLVHHAFSCIALARLLRYNYAGAQTCCGIGGMEVTNPILQIRWFLRTSDYYHTKVFTIADISFILFFFIMRMGFGTYFFINILFRFKNNAEYILYTGLLYLISLLFVVDILNYILHKYGTNKKSTSHLH